MIMIDTRISMESPRSSGDDDRVPSFAVTGMDSPRSWTNTRLASPRTTPVSVLSIRQLGGRSRTPSIPVDAWTSSVPVEACASPVPVEAWTSPVPA